MKVIRLNRWIGLVLAALGMVVPMHLPAHAEPSRAYRDQTYQFTIEQPAEWISVPVKQRAGILKVSGFQYQAKGDTAKILLRVDVRKNPGIWSKQSFPRLIWKIARKQSVYAQAYSKANARDILAASTQLSPRFYYDMDKAMIYGFSQAVINKRVYNVSNFFFVGKDTFVSLTFLCAPRNYDTALTQITNVADSFRFLPGAELPAQPPWFLRGNILALFLKGVFFLILISVGFGAGTWIERRHYASIRAREQALNHMPAIPAKLETVMAGSTQTINRAEMVYGSVVLSEDYFKGFLANLKNFLGGNLTSYESLMDRARREAILRMKADALNADLIVNVRMEASSIGKEGGSNGKGIKTVEMMAYGTAITFAREANDQVHAPHVA